MQLEAFPKQYSFHLLLVLIISVVFNCGMYLLSDQAFEQLAADAGKTGAWFFMLFFGLFYGVMISAGVIINNLISTLRERNGNHTFAVGLGTILMLFYVELLGFYEVNLSLAWFCTSLIALSIAVFFILNIAVELFFKWKQR